MFGLFGGPRRVSTGTCKSQQCTAVITKDACASAAHTLGASDTKPKTESSTDYPYGCYFYCIFAHFCCIFAHFYCMFAHFAAFCKVATWSPARYGSTSSPRVQRSAALVRSASARAVLVRCHHHLQQQTARRTMRSVQWSGAVRIQRTHAIRRTHTTPNVDQLVSATRARTKGMMQWNAVRHGRVRTWRLSPGLQASGNSNS